MMTARRIHMIGIGGAGMAPLAELLLVRGVRVTGSDLEPNEKSARLARLGAAIREPGHRAENLPGDAELVVYSSAVAPDNPERFRASELGIPQLRRGEALAEFARLYKRVCAVSGSHGKSSTTAMLVHILKHAGFHPGFMIGASYADGSPSAANGSGDDIFVTEADESDATHKLLAPELGIIPNCDDDHAWSVGGSEALRRNFHEFAMRSHRLLACDYPECRRAAQGHPDAKFLPSPAGLEFASQFGFMAIDAQLAVEAAAELGCPRETALNALSSYPGIDRRMQLRGENAARIVIEDYAHHPREVESSVALLRAQYPGRTLRIVFQPHRYARLERFFDGFAAALRKADRVVVVPVFAAWSETGSRSGADLAAAIPGGRYVTGSWEECAKEILSDDVPCPEVIAVLGAGDVEKIIPYLVARS